MTHSVRRHARGAASLVVAGMLALTACGDDGEDPAADRAEQTDPQQFRERAGEACDELRSDLLVDVEDLVDLADDDPASEDAEQLSLRLADDIDTLITQLQEIGPPEEHADEWAEWVDLLEENTEEIRDDPAATLAGGSDPARGKRISELADTLGVPACSDFVGTIDEALEARDGEGLEAGTEEGRTRETPGPPLDDETRERAERMGTDIQDVWGGLLTEGEAQCLAAGLVDVLPENPRQWDDLEFDQLPADDQAAVLDAVSDCVPTEKLFRFDDM